MLTLEDPEFMQRYVCERLGRNAEILGKHLGRRMSKPIRHHQRVVFAGIAVVEADHKLATIRAEP
jgi:hypothetical protein